MCAIDLLLFALALQLFSGALLICKQKHVALSFYRFQSNVIIVVGYFFRWLVVYLFYLFYFFCVDHILDFILTNNSNGNNNAFIDYFFQSFVKWNQMHMWFVCVRWENRLLTTQIMLKLIFVERQKERRQQSFFSLVMLLTSGKINNNDLFRGMLTTVCGHWTVQQ